MSATESKWSSKGQLQPVTTLIQLAGFVSERMDKRRRKGPKWKFRLAPDLIVQIQPFVPRERQGRWGTVIKEPLKFQCLAVEGENTDGETFEDPNRNRYFKFSIDEVWKLEPQSCGPFTSPYSFMDEFRANVAAQEACFGALRDRVVAAFNGDFFTRLRPESLLGNNCLCCGRGLTDPISQARFIGPECYGSASKSIPWIEDLTAPAEEAA